MGIQLGLSRLLGQFFVPASFLLLTAAQEHYSFTRSHLLHVAISWGVIALLLLVRNGCRKPSLSRSWRVGALLAMYQICLRVASERDSIRWTSSMIPIATYFAIQTGPGLGYPTYTVVDEEKTPIENITERKAQFAIATAAGFALLSHGYCSPGASLLAVGGAIAFAVAITLFEQSLEYSYREDELTDRSSERDIKARRCCWIWTSSPPRVQLAIRDAAAVTSLICLVASFWIEQPYLSPLTTMPAIRDLRQFSAMDWRRLMFLANIERLVKGIVAELLCSALLLATVCHTTNFIFNDICRFISHIGSLPLRSRSIVLIWMNGEEDLRWGRLWLQLQTCWDPWC
jgi:hypothetical protein